MTNKKRVHAYSDDVLGYHDTIGLKELIENKSIKPKEVIEATIERANKIESSLNPIAYKNYERALEASEKKANGYFAGIPTFIKDLTNVEGLPTRYGSEAFAKVGPSKVTDPIAKQILSMGFVNMGMSTMPEFGLTCSTEFPDLNNTVNPWNQTYTAGGSSGGAAALVAAGVVPIAHAADGGGSTRIPAACCGLVGLKPSRGRLLASGAFEKQLVEISIDGVVTRSVRDTAHFYYEAEQYFYNKKLQKIGLVTDPIDRKLNIGFIQEAALGEEVDEPTQRVFLESIALLEGLGHTLKPIKFPVTDQIKEDFKLLWGMSGFAVNRLGKILFAKEFDASKLTPFTKGLSKQFGKNFWKTPGMVKRLNRTNVSYQKFLEDNELDIILTPTIAHLTPRIGHLDMNLDYETIVARMRIMAPYTAYFNLTGGPSISLPMYHDEANDLPIGILFSAGYGQEQLLLELSYQLEQTKPWKKIYEESA